MQTASGLQYKVLVPGSGPTPTETDVALVTYKGALTDGTVSDGNTGAFHDIVRSLCESPGYEPADVYYVLGDFAAYRDARERAAADFRDQRAWARKCFLNIVNSGRFSSDRTIADYSREVWKLRATPI